MLVDVSDTTQAPTGTTKNMTTANLFTAPTFTGQVTVTGGTVTTSAPLTYTQTWNAGGVAFTGLKVVVTNTASAAGSLVVDLQVGAGTSVWSVSKAGAVTQAQSLTVTAGGITVTAGGLTVSLGGLTVSSGTSALQAVTATALTTTGRVGIGAANPGTPELYVQSGAAGASLQLTDNVNSTLKVAHPVSGSVTFSNGASTVWLTENGTITLGEALVISTGGLTVSSGTAALQALTATTGSFTGTLTVSSLISVGVRSADLSSAIQLANSNSTTNWQIGQNKTISGALEFTPSSTGGGTSFSTPAMFIDGNSSVVMGSGALGTTDTSGFLYIRAGAGAPTGVPTSYTGRIPLYFDSTNNFLYIYNGAWKKSTVYA